MKFMGESSVASIVTMGRKEFVKQNISKSIKLHTEI